MMKFSLGRSQPLLALCVAGALALATTATIAIAGSSRLQVAEVTVTSRQAKTDREELRQQLERELKNVDAEKYSGGPYLVSAKLARIDSSRHELGLAVTAEINTTIREKSSGSLLGTVVGRATAISPGENAKEAERSATVAALESAVKGVEKTLATH